MPDPVVSAFARKTAERLRQRASVLDREAAELHEISSRDLGLDRGIGQYIDSQKRRHAAKELRAAADIIIADADASSWRSRLL